MLKRRLTIISLAIFSSILLCLFSKNKLKIDKYTYYKHNFNIYLVDKNNYLALTTININSKDIFNKVEEVVNDLKINSDALPNGFIGVLNPNTQINSMSLEDKTLKINFNDSLLDIKNEEQMIESLTYSLTSIKQIDKIIIYINGNILTKLPKSGIILPAALDRTFGINKEYTFNNLENIKAVTIYHKKRDKKLEYYIPITKYMNSEKTKEEIIIEELKQNTKQFKSQINNNLKLEEEDLSNNKLTLTFNNKIFDDEEKNLIDDVGESLALSFKDTLNVKEVSLISKNKIIYKI